MKRFSIATFIIAFTLVQFSCNSSKKNIDSKPIRSELAFNTDWQFARGDGEPENWERIEIPHTPRIEPLVVNDQWQGTMWYKKSFVVNNASKKYFLHFDGVMHEADLYVNNQFVGKHVGGYLPFNVDVTQYLSFTDSNELTLRVNNQDNNQIPPGKALDVLDFNYYGGIYREVTLLETEPIYITDAVTANKPASGGVLVHFNEVSALKAKGFAQVHVKNENETEKMLHCQVTLVSPAGKISRFDTEKIRVNAGEDFNFKLDIQLDNPELWSISDPSLYKMEVNLFADNKKVDNYNLNVGVRSINLSAAGFYLNGVKTFIRGTNRHQEYPYVGYAISKNANWRDAMKIKEAGFDFVRLSHYPQDESFLDACDALGILVMDAIPGWQFIGDSVFVENSYQNIRDMVRRDRNHPSIVFWENSLNESNMPESYMIEANKILKAELPFEDTYSAGWMDNENYDLFIPARQHAKAPDYWSKYKISDRPLFIAEYGDWEYYAQNAGFNQTAYGDLKEEERTSRQLRGAGEKRLLQQALNFQEGANSNRKGPNTIGDANWLMFDYNRGYADDIESSGISDIFRIPKLAYYFYQSQRAASDTLALKEGAGAMVKIASYWTSESDQNVRVYSNCDEVALYLNDSLIEKRKPTVDQYSDRLIYPPFYFNLAKYEAGTLKAVAYINEKEQASDVVKTPGKPSNILIEIDLSGIPLSESESDLVFVYAKVVDENNTLIPVYNQLVTFYVEGGELIGENPVKAEAGIASVLLKVRKGAGNIKISAESDELSNVFELTLVK